MRRRTRAMVVALATAVPLLVVGTAAVAYWTAAGAGTGGAGAGTTTAVALAAGTVPANLVPGASGTLSTIATNPNAVEVRIASLALDTTRGAGGFAVSGGTPAGGCSASSFTFTTQTSGWTVPASGSAAIALPNSVALAAAAPSACQGATVTVYLAAGG